MDELARTKDEGALEGYGRRVAREYLKPGTEYIMGEFNVANTVEVLRRASRYGGRFGFDFGDGRDSHSRVLVLSHDQGPLWSKFYFGLIEETFKVLLGEETKISFTDSLCIAQLHLHQKE